MNTPVGKDLKPYVQDSQNHGMKSDTSQFYIDRNYNVFKMNTSSAFTSVQAKGFPKKQIASNTTKSTKIPATFLSSFVVDAPSTSLNRSINPNSFSNESIEGMKPNGDIIVFNSQNGIKQGEATLRGTDQTITKLNYERDKFHGIFQSTDKEGNSLTITFSHGIMQGLATDLRVGKYFLECKHKDNLLEGIFKMTYNDNKIIFFRYTKGELESVIDPDNIKDNDLLYKSVLNDLEQSLFRLQNLNVVLLSLN